MAHGDAREGK